MLEEILVKLDYTILISNYFGKDTDVAVRDFQLNNALVVDGIVGPKTWSKLLKAEQKFISFTDKFLSEKDIIDFAKKYNLEIAMVKAVNEIESNGRGFLINGSPVILFEGHIFWRELKKRVISPSKYLTKNSKDVLYKK